MRFRRLAVLLVFLVLIPACARKEVRTWQPGDSIICPHCGREFPVPEKLGK